MATDYRYIFNIIDEAGKFLETSIDIIRTENTNEHTENIHVPNVVFKIKSY